MGFFFSGFKRKVNYVSLLFASKIVCLWLMVQSPSNLRTEIYIYACQPFFDHASNLITEIGQLETIYVNFKKTTIGLAG